MFVGYDLEIRNQMSYTYATSGNDIYSDMNKIVKKEICKFIKSDGSIDASAMQDNWFPEINRHIFISHSSKCIFRSKRTTCTVRLSQSHGG